MKRAGLILAVLASTAVAACAPHTAPAPAVPEPIVTIEDPRAAAEARLRALAPSYAREPVDALVNVSDEGVVSVTPARAGQELDLEQSLAHDGVVVLREIAPRVSNTDAEAVRAHAEDALSHPLVLRWGDQRLPLTRSDIAPLLWTGGNALGVRAQAAEALARLLAAEFHQDSVDARFAWNGGKLSILRPSSNGRDLDIDLTAARLTSAILAGEQEVALPVRPVAPAVSSTQIEALGITELIDRGSTSFAGSVPEKKANIRLAAERLNGVVVPPGGTFSFNRELGPTTLEAGFDWGFAITAGADGPRTVPSVAGGICQVATTLFQPVFWSGFPLQERYAHAYWIPAYASRGVVGLDVTVDGDAGLDFRWTNPTSEYVLVQAGVEGDSVWFALYGRKPGWRVDVAPAEISNPRPADPTPVTQEEPSFPVGKKLQVESARDGFDVAVTRTVTDGSDSRKLTLHTSYQASHTVTLVGTGGL